MSKTVTLKRIIMIKAIVTPAFKGSLVKELTTRKQALEEKMTQEKTLAPQYVELLHKEDKSQDAKLFAENLRQSWVKIDQELNELVVKIHEAEGLVLDSEFTQGPLEGPVEVSIGDNLYEKVGATEIVVRDGIIIEIRNNENL